MHFRRIFLFPTPSAPVLTALAILALAALLAAALPSPAARAQANMTVINGTPPTYAVNIPGSPPISFYNRITASQLVDIYDEMVKAAIICKADDYNQQVARFNRALQALYNIQRDSYNTYVQIGQDIKQGGIVSQIFVGFGSIPDLIFHGESSIAVGQRDLAREVFERAKSDYRAWQSAVPLLRKFPQDCSPPATSAPPQTPAAPPPPPPLTLGTPVSVTIPANAFTCRTPEVEALIAQIDSAIAQDQKAISNIQAQMDGLSSQLTDLALKNGPRQQQAELKAQLDSARAAVQKYEQTVRELEAQKAKLKALPPCGAGMAPPPSPPPAPPSAQPLPPAIAPEHSMAPLPIPPDGLYAGGKAGWTHLGTVDAVTHFEDGGTATDRDRHNEGFDVGGRLGIKQGPWRFEGEFNYRRNGLSEIISTTDPKASGSTQAFTFLANAIYDFDLAGFPWTTPHIGGGIGLAHLQAKQKIAGFTLLNSSDTQFAYQAIAGLRFPLAPNWAVDLDYRYLATTDPSYRDVAGNRVTSTYQTHNLIASLTFSFAPPPLPPAFPVMMPPPPR